MKQLPASQNSTSVGRETETKSSKVLKSCSWVINSTALSLGTDAVTDPCRGKHRSIDYSSFKVAKTHDNCKFVSEQHVLLTLC